MERVLVIHKILQRYYLNLDNKQFEIIIFYSGPAVLLLRKFHGQRRMAGYILWGRELDASEHAHTY